MNTQEINLRTNKTHNPRERKCHIVEGRRCGDVILREKDHGYYGEEGALVMGRGEREKSAQGIAQGKYFPKDIEKMKGVGFHEFLQATGLKDRSFRSPQCGSYGAQLALQCSCGEGEQIAW